MGRNKNQEIALKILKIAGMGVFYSAVSVLAPMFPYLVLKAYLKKVFEEEYKPQQLRNSVYYLKRRKFIAYKNKQFTLTKLGLKYLNRKSIEEIIIKKVNWDGKWRVLTFDIPESQISARHIFRQKLKELGFFHFQRSVFVIPYPCEKEIDQLTSELGILEHVHVLRTERFRSDKVLIERFNL